MRSYCAAELAGRGDAIFVGGGPVYVLLFLSGLAKLRECRISGFLVETAVQSRTAPPHWNPYLNYLTSPKAVGTRLLSFIRLPPQTHSVREASTTHTLRFESVRVLSRTCFPRPLLLLLPVLPVLSLRSAITATALLCALSPPCPSSPIVIIIFFCPFPCNTITSRCIKS